MRKTLGLTLLIATVTLAGCAVRPVSGTINQARRVYNTTGDVYRATRSVADLVNPIELIYLSVEVEPGEEAEDVPARPVNRCAPNSRR